MAQERILSIRLSPDGLSFWTTGLTGKVSDVVSARRDLWSVSGETELAFDPQRNLRDNIASHVQAIEAIAGGVVGVEVYPDTIRAVMIPAEYAPDDSFERLLEINDIVVGKADEVTCTDVAGVARAVMVYDREGMEILREGLGDVVVCSPYSINELHIQKYGPNRRRASAVYLTPEHAYISVFEKRGGALLYADAMKWIAPADIVYYLSVLDEEFGLRKGRVYLRGVRTDEIGRLLRKYFRKTRCE